MKATLQRDRLTGRAWLDFPSKPDAEVIAALKAEGWRWSGYRKAWHNPRRYVVPPKSVEFEDFGECDYSSERAERLEARADKAEARSDAAHARVRAIADHIPLGQPILVGHHSERRARKDAERIRSGMDAAVSEGRYADDLRQRAEASERHQAAKESAGVISRRLDRFRAELRKIDRTWEQSGLPMSPEASAYRSALAADIAKNEAALAELGPTPAAEEYKVGEVISVRGHVVRIDRVNRKTISGTIIQGGASGMTGKWDRSWIRGRVAPGGQ